MVTMVTMIKIKTTKKRALSTMMSKALKWGNVAVGSLRLLELAASIVDGVSSLSLVDVGTVELLDLFMSQFKQRKALVTNFVASATDSVSLLQPHLMLTTTHAKATMKTTRKR